MEPLNRKLVELQKTLEAMRLAWLERAAARRQQRLEIPRWELHDDSDDGDEPDCFVGARLTPHRPLGGSAIALPEPADDLEADAVGVARES